MILIERVDSHRKAVVDHILHIVILPGLHGIHRDAQPPDLLPRTMSIDSYSSIPDLSGILQTRSPLHLEFPLITRLSFNDAGRITHHRDFWDVKVRFLTAISACVELTVGSDLLPGFIEYGPRHVDRTVDMHARNHAEHPYCR